MNKNARITITIIIFSIFAITFLSESCTSNTQNEVSTEESETIDYISVGKNHVIEAKSALSKNLIDAINYGGAEYAIGFCNSKALIITDSMSRLTGTQIKRVTDKPRNPNNSANETEMSFIKELKAAQVNGQALNPKLQELMGKMIAYYPIEINSMCLQCHGIKETDIKGVVMTKLNSLYPNDMATGYRENNIRGIWVVEMEKK
jgi:nitrate reductase cytochrome c-type subunit